MVRTDATHIFDGLNSFPTHVAHMRLGAFVKEPSPWPFADAAKTGRDSQLYNVALQWLREDREHRRELEKAGRKTRGARSDEVRSLMDSNYTNLCHLLNIVSRYLRIQRPFTGSKCLIGRLVDVSLT